MICPILLSARKRGSCTPTNATTTASTASRPSSRIWPTRATRRASPREEAFVATWVPTVVVSVSMCHLPHRREHDVFLVGLMTSECTGYPSFVHDEDAVGHGKHLGQL